MSCLTDNPDERLRVRSEITRMEEAIAKASDDRTSRHKRLKRYLRVLSRPCRMESIRCVMSAIDLLDPVNADELERYRAAGFNTVVVTDRTFDGTSFTELTANQIEERIRVAREHNMRIMISCFADEQYSEQLNATIPALTGDQVRARIALWDAHNEGDVVGVFFVADDMFLTRTLLNNQFAWKTAVRSVTTSIPVFGMIGEFSINPPDGDAGLVFNPLAFDHLIVLMYPYSLGSVWSTPDENGVQRSHGLDSTVEDADDRLRAYIEEYIQTLNERYFTRLFRNQLILPVVQAFNYVGEPPSQIVRAADVQIQAEYVSAIIRTSVANQRDNCSVGMFWWGSPDVGLMGLRDNPELTEFARRANVMLGDLATCGGHLPCLMLSELEGN